MKIYHLAAAHWPGVGGVQRFGRHLREAFPEVRNIGTAHLERVQPGDVVCTDNHLSCEIPAEIKTIVVHHGCAQTHWDRDPPWRNDRTRYWCEMQREMFRRANRTFVAPSRWVAEQFRAVTEEIGVPYEPVVIPHWVPLIQRQEPGGAARPVCIGDWRNFNKGRDLIDEIAKAAPEIEFRELAFRPEDDRARRSAYAGASAYLCLSLSEGAPYSVADAEAASLAIVTTEVGNCREFPDVRIVERDDLMGIVAALRAAIAEGRRAPSFYETFTLERWREAWRALL